MLHPPVMQRQLSPIKGCTLSRMSIIGKANGAVFDERELKFSLGEGVNHKIPKGLERALERFKKNEVSIIKLMPKRRRKKSKEMLKQTGNHERKRSGRGQSSTSMG
ncbi:hypothetical protein Avbf_07081 [Armadillidium vulgare]|nr:hypothetical protein Avbf_07081 [Armadillidium vulgare]